MSTLSFISIVSINWNSVQDTLELLASVHKSNYPKDKYEVIVVDNGSTDDSVNKIKNAYPKTRIIALTQNIGVSARNKGFRAAEGEIIVTLDSDATIETNTLSAIAKKIRGDSSIGILGVKILNKKTLTPEFSPMYVNFYTGMVSTLNPDNGTTKLTFLPFICSAMPKRIFKKIGFLEKVFFFYGEDFDFCMRIKNIGLKVVYFPETTVFHGKNKTTSTIPSSIVYHHYYKGLFRNIYKYGNLIQKLSVTFFQLILIPFFRLLVRRENTFGMRWWGLWWNLKRTKKDTNIFLIILSLGIILRIFALSQHDFWFDEAFTYHIARLPIQDLFKAVLSDNNPPLYYLLIHFVLKISSNEVILRIPSLIASIFSIVLLYAMLKKLINQKVGLIASALFSLSPLSIYIATEARLHSLALLLSIGLMFSFLILMNKPDFKAILIFFIISTLALYTQYYLVLLFIPFTMFVLTKKNLKIKKWIAIASCSLAMLIPWLALSLGIHNNCACPNTLLSLPAALVTPLIGGVGEITLRSFPSLPLPILILFALTALVTLFFFKRGLIYNRLINFAYLIPLTLLSLFGLILPVFSPKAFAVFSPFYFAIVALGISSYRKSGLITLIITIFIGTISIIQITNPYFAGTRLKPIDSIIKNNSSIPVAHTSLLTYYSLNYYANENQKHILISQNPLSAGTLKFIGGQKQEVNINTPQLWVVDSEKWTGKKDRQLSLKKVFNIYDIEKTYKVDRISVRLLKQK